MTVEGPGRRAAKARSKSPVFVCTPGCAYGSGGSLNQSKKTFLDLKTPNARVSSVSLTNNKVRPVAESMICCLSLGWESPERSRKLSRRGFSFFHFWISKQFGFGLGFQFGFGFGFVVCGLGLGSRAREAKGCNEKRGWLATAQMLGPRSLARFGLSVYPSSLAINQSISHPSIESAFPLLIDVALYHKVGPAMVRSQPAVPQSNHYTPCRRQTVLDAMRCDAVRCKQGPPHRIISGLRLLKLDYGGGVDHHSYAIRADCPFHVHT